MVMLIINADDYGLSNGVCRAIHILMEKGAISSTTMMLAAEGAIDRCRAWNIKNLAGKVGVHLQLTNGRPILSKEKVPGLIDHSTGEFKSKSELARLNPEEVELEWRAQIEMAHSLLDSRPSHLDSHHGAHHLPGLADVFIKLALEYDLPVRDCPAMRDFMPDAKLLGSDLVIYDWTARGLGCAELKSEIRQAIASAIDGNIIEIVTHPGYSDAELRKKSTLNDLRESDYHSLLDLAHAKWLEHEGIKLINFSEIQ